MTDSGSDFGNGSPDQSQSVYQNSQFGGKSMRSRYTNTKTDNMFEI